MILIRHNDNDKVLLKLPGHSLRDADLSGSKLKGSALYAIEITGLRRATGVVNVYQKKASLSGVRLVGADLRDAVLSGEEIVRADFASADLTGATVVRTHFINCNFASADLTGLRMMNTVFSGCPTLSAAKGLADVEFLGPSVLDMRTLRATIGSLPDSFLLGAGYSATEIRELRRLYEGKKFYSCFISYARQDGDFADYFRKRLIRSGISCWQDTHDLRGGEYWREQIYDAIEKRDKLILVCSKNSLLRPSVVAEILEAIDRERAAKSQKLFPMRIDDYVLSQDLEEVARDKVGRGEWRENWVTYVRAYHIPDFSGSHSSKRFRDEYEHLVEALRADARRIVRKLGSRRS